jgi:predicted nucleic acid-binding protein
MRPTAVAARYFLDSNVLLYIIDEDARRTPIAKRLAGAEFVISVQVLNEFVNVATKKFKLENAAIRDGLEPIRFVGELVPVTVETHERAWEIFCATNFGIYDSNIIAAAELSGCDVLYSEDMNHGQKISRVEIRNPFL